MTKDSKHSRETSGRVLERLYANVGKRRQVLYPFLLGIFAVAAVTGPALLLRDLFGDDRPYSTSPLFLIAVLAASWYGGLRAGITAACASVIAIGYALVVPHHTFNTDWRDIAWLIGFFGAALLLGRIATTRREAEVRLSQSQQDLADFFESSPVPMHWVEAKGTIIWANSAELEMLGYDREDFVGRTVSYFHTDAAVAKEMLDRLRKGEDLHDFEARLRAKDGSTRDVEVSSNVYWRDGRFMHARCIIKDVTEVKQAEARLSFLADASALLSSSLDYEQTLASLAQLSVPAIADWCTIDLVEGDNLRRVVVVHSDSEKQELAKSLQDRDLRGSDVLQRVLRRGRSDLYPEMTDELIEKTITEPALRRVIQGLGLRSSVIAPLLAREHVVGVVTMVYGHSNRRYTQADRSFIEDLARRAGIAIDNARLYSEAQRVQAQLQLAADKKDEFLGLVAHELRTPITTIYGGARFLNSHRLDMDDDTLRELLGTMEEDASRLHRLVENLLALARMERGYEIPREPVHVQRLIEGVVASYRRHHPKREIALQIEAGSLIIDAGPTYLEQVAVNLIENADKYSPPGVSIDIGVRETRGEVEVTVRDRGPGLREDELELVFDSFYRSERTSGKAQGKGLGLAVCRRLVEAHGGRIWAKSRPGGGLEVGFALPMTAEEDGAVRALTNEA
ncbi:MAG TPA: ATP-binding protein [Dehalococcoidia bacterium]|nr:ATP-binding protein [Dehalococcoidia bacterium]